MLLFLFLVLFFGVIICNCIVKVVMEENMVDVDYVLFVVLLQFYQCWVDGGVGLIIIGNVMVDGCVMIGFGGVVLEDDCYFDCFIVWVEMVCLWGVQMWMQINYFGWQMLVVFG